MHAGIAANTLELQADVENFLYARFSFRHRFQLGIFDRLIELDVERFRNELRDAIDLSEAHVENAADIFDSGLGGERAEGDDLRDLFAAVLFSDVLNHFSAAIGAEIDIDIRHADALRIQEAFEEQTVLERVDIGDSHGIADQASGGGAASRSDRDALFFREANEIPDDQEVSAEFHLLDHPDFTLQPLGVLR